MNELYSANREGIFGSSLPEGAEPYQPGIDDSTMLDRIAAEHQERIEAVRLPDGTVPEMVYPMAEHESSSYGPEHVAMASLAERISRRKLGVPEPNYGE